MKESAKAKAMLEIARERLKASRATALLGFEVESVAEGRAVLRMNAEARHKQIHGVVHGGILAAMADTAGAIAAYSVVPHGAELATIELKINYLEPVPGGQVKAVAHVLRRGRNFVVTECEVLNEKGKLAAKALMTFGAAGGHSITKNT
jgi:uncharacterized protein (TIGR00369 family)